MYAAWARAVSGTPLAPPGQPHRAALALTSLPQLWGHMVSTQDPVMFQAPNPPSTMPQHENR